MDIQIMSDKLIIKNIDSTSLRNLYSIYKNTSEFKYATGLFDMPIEFIEFSNQVCKFVLKSNNFMLDISLLESGETVGFIKGTVMLLERVIWINAFAIDKPFQGKGYGKGSIFLVEDYFKKHYNSTKIFLSVYKNNRSGMNFWEKCRFKKCDCIPDIKSQKLDRHVQIMWKML